MSYRKDSHTIYDLKYHIIWCTKYRYRVLRGDIANKARGLIREICKTNYTNIHSGHISADHIHILVSVPPTVSISKLVQYIKGKSSRKLLMHSKELNKRYWGQHLWARGYFATTVGNLNEKQVAEYIENQEVENKDDNFLIGDASHDFNH